MKKRVVFLFTYTLIFLPFVACKNAPHQSTEINTAEITTDSSWTLLPFIKIDSVNPVLGPGTGRFADPIRRQTVNWEEKDVFNPAIVVRGDTLLMLYRAEDSVGKYAGTSRIGLAKSVDGVHFTRLPAPVFFPANDAQKKYEWEGGCEDPRVVEDSAGVYYMMYTAYDGDKARLLVASSSDLLHWTKYGPVFLKAFNGKYLNQWSKSGSVVSAYKDGKIMAVKINGKYWMYWGDVNIGAAVSDDLISWQPIEIKPGEQHAIPLRHNAVETPDLKIVVGPRAGKFDSDIVEPGPPAMLTDKGILLIYNGRNIPAIGDSTLPEGTYSAGQVLLDKNDPTKILQRTDHHFLTPDKPYEKTGQINYVCFVEGLAYFKNKWFLYYGTADSKIAVAVKD
ncbi:MAG: glycoside hydrolase family 130 protein [Chitinophagaceae bacterium]